MEISPWKQVKMKSFEFESPFEVYISNVISRPLKQILKESGRCRFHKYLFRKRSASYYQSILFLVNLHAFSVELSLLGQLHLTKLELRLLVGSNLAPGLSEIRDGENFWHWCWLEIELHALSSVNHTTKTIRQHSDVSAWIMKIILFGATCFRHWNNVQTKKKASLQKLLKKIYKKWKLQVLYRLKKQIKLFLVVSGLLDWTHTSVLFVWLFWQALLSAQKLLVQKIGCVQIN